MEEETDLVLMDFSVVDECGSEEEEGLEDSHPDDIQVLDEITSSKPSKSTDLFEDMVVLDISTSPSRESEEVKKSYRSRRSDRSRRYGDKSSSKERSSRDYKISSRNGSRKSNDKRYDSRRQDRSSSRESRYKLSSDRGKQTKEKDKKEIEKRSSGKSSQHTPTKDPSKTSRSSGQNDLKKNNEPTKTSTSKPLPKVSAKETQNTEKVTENKEKTTSKTVSKQKEGAEGESENEGITISADDSIFSGMNVSDLSKSDFVTLTVVDEDDNVETHSKIVTSKDTIPETSKSNAAKNIKEPIPSTSKITIGNGNVKTMQNLKVTKVPEKPVSISSEVKKAPLNCSVKSQSETSSSPRTERKTEVEMVVVEDIDKSEKSTSKLKTVSAPPRKSKKESPCNKFKVTEELFTVENMEEKHKQVSVVGVNDLQQKSNTKKEDKPIDQGKKIPSTKRVAKKTEVEKDVEMVVVEDNTKTPNSKSNAISSRSKELNEKKEDLDKFKVKEELFPVRSLERPSKEVNIVGIDEVAKTKDVNTDRRSEMDLVELVDFNVKDEDSSTDIKEKTSDAQKSEVATTTQGKDIAETKWFEVPREEDEEMEISIMDDLNTGSKDLGTSPETDDDDVIEVIFSNGEDEEEVILGSKTDFEKSFAKNGNQTDLSTNVTQDQKEDHNCKERKDNKSEELDEKDIKSENEPEQVIEDGTEIIVLSDNEDENEVESVNQDIGSGCELKSEEKYVKEVKPKFQGIFAKSLQNQNYIERKGADSEKIQSTEDADDNSPADDKFVSEEPSVPIKDEVLEEEDDLGEIDEEAFLAMMQSEGLTVDEEKQDETEEKSDPLDESSDSTKLLITVSQTSEKRNVKSSEDSQIRSPVDRISSNLAKIRKEMENSSEKSKSSTGVRRSQEKDKARSSRERSKDRGSMSSPKPSRGKEAQKSSSREGDLRQVLKSKQSPGSRDLRDVIKERKAKERAESETEKGPSEGEFISSDLRLCRLVHHCIDLPVIFSVYV